MTVPLQRLIESLRNELQQYGEMLALLEQQRQVVLQQCPDDVLHLISTINQQSLRIEKAREIREGASVRLARSLEQPDTASFQELIPLLPDACRPLVTALIQENNSLLVDIRKRAEQNHELLQQSLDFMQDFISDYARKEGGQNGDNKVVAMEALPSDGLRPAEKHNGMGIDAKGKVAYEAIS